MGSGKNEVCCGRKSQARTEHTDENQSIDSFVMACWDSMDTEFKILYGVTIEYLRRRHGVKPTFFQARL